MLSHHHKFAIALIVLVLYMSALIGEGAAEDLAVKLVINPNKTDVYLGSEPIALTAKVPGKNLTFKWELIGPGNLEGKGSARFYTLPETIEGTSAQALITVIVIDETGQELRESITFNILPSPTQIPTPTPTPKPATTPAVKKGMSKKTIIAVGAGAVAALGGGIALAVGGGGGGDNDGDIGTLPDDPNNPFTGIFKRYIRSDPYFEITYIFTLFQNGTSITGTFDDTVHNFCGCTARLIVDVTGTVSGNSANIFMEEKEEYCYGPGSCWDVAISNKSDTYTLENDGRILRSSRAGNDYIRQ